MVAPLLASDPRAAGLDYVAERLCMLLLLQPPSAWAPAAAWADTSQHARWPKLLETSAVSILESEAKYLRHQFSQIGEVLAGGGDHEVEECGTCTPRRPAAAGAGAAVTGAGAAAGAGAPVGGEALMRARGAGGAAGAVEAAVGGGGCCH